MNTAWLSTGGWVVAIIVIVVIVGVVVVSQVGSAFVDRSRGRSVSNEQERLDQPPEARRRWRR